MEVLVKRSQSTERRFLRFSHTLDARNIESLVGAILPQRLESLTTLHIPQHNGPVISTTSKLRSIRTDFECIHDSLMRLLHPHACTAGNLPPAQLAITTSTDEHLSIWTPGDCIDQRRMSNHDAHSFSTRRVPYEQFPALSPTTYRG